MNRMVKWASRTAVCVGLASMMTSASAQLLLVVESGGDRVLSLDRNTGAVLNPNFIVGGARFNTPIQAISSGRNTIFVSDQISDAIYEYDVNGNFIQTFAGAAQGIDNVRGIAVHNNAVYATIGNGTFAGTIQKYDMSGNRIGTFATVDAFDIHFRANDVLVSDIDGDDINQYDFSGNLLGKLVNSDGLSNIDFPQQIFERGNGNLLVGGFSPPAGLYEFSATGAAVGVYDPNFGVRGVYELGNGEYIFSKGTALAAVNPQTNAVRTILSGSSLSFRYIDAVTAVPEPGTMALLLASGVVGSLALRRRRK